MYAYEHPEISAKFSIWTILNIRIKSEELILSVLNTAQRVIVIDILQMAEVVNSKKKRRDNSDKDKNMVNSYAYYATSIYLVYSPLKKYKEVLKKPFKQHCAQAALMRAARALQHSLSGTVPYPGY